MDSCSRISLINPVSRWNNLVSMDSYAEIIWRTIELQRIRCCEESQREECIIAEMKRVKKSVFWKNYVVKYIYEKSVNWNFAFDDQNENRYRCACFHKRCVT